LHRLALADELSTLRIADGDDCSGLQRFRRKKESRHRLKKFNPHIGTSVYLRQRINAKLGIKRFVKYNSPR